nr:SRPBCC family protein [uncultured Chryseobacterium sp.]
MKTIFKIIGVFILLVAFYSIFAMLTFSKVYHYEKSIVINAPKEKVWSHISSTRAFNVWNPFAKADKNIVITYKGKEGKIGDGYYWKGNSDVGEGEQEIVAVVPYQKVTSRLLFFKPWEGKATSNLMMSPEGNKTKVTWTMTNELTPVMKPMKPFMDMQMGKMFDQGFENLKIILKP